MGRKSRRNEVVVWWNEYIYANHELPRFRDVASGIGMSVGTVHHHLHRAAQEGALCIKPRFENSGKTGGQSA